VSGAVVGSSTIAGSVRSGEEACAGTDGDRDFFERLHVEHLDDWSLEPVLTWPCQSGGASE